MPGMFHTFNIKNIKKLIFQIALPLLVGFVSAFLSGDQKAVYGALTLPPYAPPAWLFGVVWPVLYVLMGVSAYLVQKMNDKLVEHRQYIRDNGIDLPEVRNWKWEG